MAGGRPFFLRDGADTIAEKHRRIAEIEDRFAALNAEVERLRKGAERADGLAAGLRKEWDDALETTAALQAELSRLQGVTAAENADVRRRVEQAVAAANAEASTRLQSALAEAEANAGRREEQAVAAANAEAGRWVEQAVAEMFRRLSFLCHRRRISLISTTQTSRNAIAPPEHPG